MLAQAELNRLRNRKQELLARSDVIRGDIRDRCADFRSMRRQCSALLVRLKEPKKLLIIGAALAGIVFVGRRSKRLKFIAKLAAGWRLLSLVKPLWQGYRVARALRR